MAKGKHAISVCDRSGFEYPLSELVEQYENQQPTGLMVGRDMLDEDHPQWQVGALDASDDQSLKNPRPERDMGRRLFAWNPVGGGVTEMGSRTVGLDMSGHVGRVTVTTS